MDLTELSALAGQDLTAEQQQEVDALIKASFPKLHKEIEQRGFRAGLSTTKEKYENTGGTGELDKARVEVKRLEADLVDRDAKIEQLSTEQPDTAQMQAQHQLQIETLRAKYENPDKTGLLDVAKRDLDAERSTIENLHTTGFKRDLRTALDKLHLKPDPAELATYKLEGRYEKQGEGWVVYEEVVKDGKRMLSPILVDAGQTPAEALAHNYAGTLPKDAFKDERQKSADFKHDGSAGSNSMKMSDFNAKSPGEQARLGQKIAKNELTLVDD